MQESTQQVSCPFDICYLCSRLACRYTLLRVAFTEPHPTDFSYPFLTGTVSPIGGPSPRSAANKTAVHQKQNQPETNADRVEDESSGAVVSMVFLYLKVS